jgi:SET domain-containing protein
MKNETNWGTRWLNPKAKAYKSKIHGLGVRAIKNIKKGEVVGVLGGLIIHRDKIKKYWESEGHVGIQIHKDFYIVPLNRKELEKYGVYNHSCEPNAGFGSESIILYAIKNIKPNEEIAFDYSFCELDKPAFKCNCGSKDCRKIIKPTDWKLSQLQKRFGKYFSPFVKEKFN